MSLHQLRVTDPGKLSCRTFFEVACERAIERYAGCGRGTFCFVLSGLRGGTWTLDLDAARVVKGRVKDPLLLMAMSEEDFLSWIGHRLDVVKAYEVGRIKVTGPLASLKELASFMAFARADLTSGALVPS